MNFNLMSILIFETNRDLIHFVNRQKAFDGKSLSLTPALARLFKSNDFLWKKAIMGCALSHLILWKALADDPSSNAAYFILEDDARLHPGWRDAWTNAQEHLPDNWDCVYLGGILPPNRLAFQHTLERVAPGLSRVALNTIFRQPQPTRYFHFCAYAYVLSKRGAAKILQSIKDRDGYWTSADHMICNRVDTMNLYILDPLVAGASQDDDPVYQKSEFNNFNRVDTFDSDLWNNDERFSEDEINRNLSINNAIDIQQVFSEFIKPVSRTRFVSLNGHIGVSTLYEKKWLEELFKIDNLVFESVSETELYDKSDTIIVVLMKPKMNEQLQWLEKLRYITEFKILHFSDEDGSDPIHMYSWPEVKGVMRFYNRPNLDPKVIVLPLGYHHQFNGYPPSIVSRTNTWSFVGTNWHNRSEEMKSLMSITPNVVKFFNNWNDSLQLNATDYISLLLSSKFMPCPRGNNVETYRFYEALESGCIPIFIDIPENEQWLKLFNNNIPFLKLQTWDQVAILIQHLLKNPDQMEQYASTLRIAWMKYKAELKAKIVVWLTTF